MASLQIGSSFNFPSDKKMNSLFSRHTPKIYDTRACNSFQTSTTTSFDESKNGCLGRRQAMTGAGSMLASITLGNSWALAEKATKGYQSILDNNDGYAFIYPFGWQEVAVKGQDAVFKDIIEPLESVSINIVKTDKSNLHELGTPEQVAKALVENVLTTPSQKSQLIDVKEREANGKTYYTFEFLSKASNYTRHAVGAVAIADGKFYTLLTGANERRWSKMQEKLQTVVDSFTLLN